MLFRAGHRSTRVRSLRRALDEFLAAPSSEAGRSNEELVVGNLGVKGIHLVDPPSYDAVSLKYGRRVRTFEEAFRACWGGQRDWLRFDIDTLRECDDLGALQLPPRIEAAIMRQEEAEERRAIAGEDFYSGVPYVVEESAPPLELVRRAPQPSRRGCPRRRRPVSRAQRAKLRRRYRKAQRALRKAAEALRCAT